MSNIFNTKKEFYGIKWDWFEKTRWLSILTGILFTTSLVLIILSTKLWDSWTMKQRIGMIITIISLELLSFGTSTLVNLIREDHVSFRVNKK